ncbi:ras GEF domain-containing protein [Phanerochaete sordida]|uniref:Ras GEF domain-containing protein n=1 Tax=Phanerochaete sordida TaxID=48140 RepID=A0A9P3GFV6_9APHY|nr:ras GEF domain-containing protein [Phanerochaete sordida]
MATTPYNDATEGDDDSSRVATPTAPSHRASLAAGDVHPAQSSASNASDDIHAYSALLASELDTVLHLNGTPGARPTESSHPNPPSAPIVLPLPTPGASRTQSAYVLPDVRGEEAVVDLSDLPPDIATADISIAPDFSFVETSSGAAAREIKRRYDQYLGVGKDVRSPYAITAFVNIYGKQMYRVGHRDMSAPAAASTVDDVDGHSTRVKSTSVESTASTSLGQGSAAHPAHPRRRSRMSINSFLPPSMFKNGQSHPPPKSPSSSNQDGSRSPPVRKLRKTRSIPNLASPTPEPSTSVPPPPPVSSGRPHAHSVSSVDAFRPPITSISTVPPTQTQDVFAEIMSWNSVPNSPLSSSSQLRSSRSFYSPSEKNADYQQPYDPSADAIRHPFGRGVTFDTPACHSPSHLTSPPVIREMQSFESGLTARAIDSSPRSIRIAKERARLSDDSVAIPEDDTAPLETPVEEEPQFEALAELPAPSIYATDLFDVLQNYKGIPTSIDSIALDPYQTTIRLSLKTEESAAPRDDPRFVIWGEVQTDEFGGISPSRSTADMSAANSAGSRRKSTKDSPDTPHVRIPSEDSTRRVLVAATIERWIAQLTSELNYDELLIFFLTYRTYFSAYDLGHLLISRFHWALARPTSTRDEMVRRIVRVRTFIAIRYWLLTFFNIDFVPNPDLRALFAGWLNDLRKDRVLAQHKDAMSIVMKLRKVVRDCKNAYTESKDSADRAKAKIKPGVPPTPQSLGDLSGGNFAAALRKAVNKDEDDSDLDLNLDGVDSSRFDFGISSSFPNLANPSTAVDLAMLRQPLHLAFLPYGGKQTPSSSPPTVVPAQLAISTTHTALSRVVVNAIGRLGRWKRVLNYRTTNARAPLRAPIGFGTNCVEASTFDVEASETGDLLLVKGGVEQYLKMIETQMVTKKPHLMFRLSRPDPPPPYEGATNPHYSAISQQDTLVESLEPVRESSDEGGVLDEPVNDPEPVPAPDPVEVPDPEEELTPPEAKTEPTTPSAPAQSPPASIRSSLHTSMRSSIMSDDTSVEFSGNTRWRSRFNASADQMDVVSIDELDSLSDFSSEGGDPREPLPPGAGLRRHLRRLPNRRDFEFVRQSVESASSMGVRTHDSVLSAGSSVVSSAHVSGSAEFAGPIQQWQMNALVDSLSDDEEAGDVEAALRRLEGQISTDAQQHKRTKVDGWVQSIRDRLANGHFGPERRRYSSDDEDYGEVQSSMHGDGENGHAGPSQRRASRSSASHVSSARNSVSSALHDSPFAVTVPAAEEARAPAFPPGLGHPVPPVDGKPAPEDVVPLEILQSRVPSRPTTSAGSARGDAPPLPNPLNMNPGQYVKEKSLKRHRSFVLSYKSENLMHHFTMIDRELFLGVKFQELVSQVDWMAPSDEFNVLDWSQFMKDRKTKSGDPNAARPSGLTAIRCRFNLMANFVIAEIVITHPSERLMVFSKFVRIAWKAYSLKNFSTLVAILSGLDSQWVKKALRQSNAKPGIWESRMLRDLLQWTTSDGDFKHIRSTIDNLSQAKPRSSTDATNTSAEAQSTARSRAASEGKPPAPPACIPFFGVYLSELYRYSSLPDLIDPTAPHAPVRIDPETNTIEAPAHPEVFANLTPLPPTMQLEALINVHKQRLVAGVVKALVAGQHLASKVQHPVEKKLFQKCLRLRGLTPDTLLRALTLYENWES